MFLQPPLLRDIDGIKALGNGEMARCIIFLWVSHQRLTLEGAKAEANRIDTNKMRRALRVGAAKKVEKLR